MSDDAAQDKTTEDGAKAAAAGADQQGGTADNDKAEAADQPAASGEPSTPAVDEKSDAPVKPELTKKSDDSEKKAQPAKSEQADKPAKDSGKPAAAASSGLGGSIKVPVIAAIVAGVALVAAIATAGALGWQSHNRGGELSERDAATEAACEFGRVVSIYDDKTMDDFIKQVKERSTGEFLTNFNSTADALKDVMISVQGKSSLAEIHCAWQSGDADKATVIMLISQVRQNSLMQQPDRLTLPVVAELEKEDGKWMMANFDSPALKGMSVAPTGGGDNTTAPTTGAPAPTTQAPAPGN
ncbi:hypothetical protein JK358_02150 [Nocardia sp. 2]|uniref:Mce-associated membrane protein n=1 Tax=Nocardia acididurans TaxID=2802282 RepID=A0ABS1LYS0_9NOCA|nr:hypothetical protein [Nocardia acididurans]MBL1073191.1 hypothetical protein [Nocardia acididurans]